MKKITNYIRIVFILFVFCMPQRGYSVENIKTISVIFSMDANLPAYQGFLEGLHEEFSKSSQPYNLIIENLDIVRFSKEEDLRKMVHVFNEKYKSLDLDLIIMFGPGTFQLLEKHDFKPMAKIPIINLDFIEMHNGIPSNIDALHININVDYFNSLKTAIELFPDYTDVYIINGASATDFYVADKARQASVTFKDSHRFIFFNGTTLDSIMLEVQKISPQSIIFVPSFLEDSDHIPYATAMVVRLISAKSGAPVFMFSDDFIKGDAMGGYVYSFIELGMQTAKISQEVLGGKPIKEFSVNELSFNKHMYDWQKLKQWNLINSKVIPADSTFFHQETNFFIEYKWYLLGALLFLIGQTTLILFLIDLNKRQKAVAKQHSENEQLYRELVREDRLSRMSELTASLSHELNQPLTAILYNAQAGKRFLDSGKLDDKQAAEILDNIIEDDKRAGSLISSVRSLMKLEERAKEKVNLNNLIAETEKLFHSESIAHHIVISLELHNQPVFVYGDKIQLQQVLLNLLFNAANSMENNNSENKKIRIHQYLLGGEVTVSIQDTGSGIDESLKEQLFNSFVTSRPQGMGIGLAVSKSIIEAHDGKIWAKNILSGGAEFSFKLNLFENGKS